LLEVGTGFHPELTGHENVYLYGAILGMDRWEVTRKFDEIVAFAEIEKFINTPVKRYSSGMYMRLAFAVAAHIETEILLVDEVLAVGDAAFQKKCLGKMGDVSKEGRTVLFVSHNMKAIASLCKQCILLDKGKINLIGSAREVTKEYLLNATHDVARGQKDFGASPDLPFSIISVWTSDVQNNVTAVFSRSSSIVINTHLDIRSISANYLVAIDIKAVDDTLLFRTHSFEQEESFKILEGKGLIHLKCILPPNLFPADKYRLGIITAIAGEKELQNVYPVLEVDVIQDQLLGDLFANIPGMLTPSCEWKRD
jgi:lipopolysaccharide transport system ATP-binding protein